MGFAHCPQDDLVKVSEPVNWTHHMCVGSSNALEMQTYAYWQNLQYLVACRTHSTFPGHIWQWSEREMGSNRCCTLSFAQTAASTKSRVGGRELPRSSPKYLTCGGV